MTALPPYRDFPANHLEVNQGPQLYWHDEQGNGPPFVAPGYLRSWEQEQSDMQELQQGPVDAAVLHEDVASYTLAAPMLTVPSTTALPQPLDITSDSYSVQQEPWLHSYLQAEYGPP